MKFYIKDGNILVIEEPSSELLQAAIDCESGADDGSKLDSLLTPEQDTAIRAVFGDDPTIAPVVIDGRIELCPIAATLLPEGVTAIQMNDERSVETLHDTLFGIFGE